MFDENTQSPIVNNVPLQINDLTEVEELSSELTDDELDLVGGGMPPLFPGDQVRTLRDGWMPDVITVGF